MNKNLSENEKKIVNKLCSQVELITTETSAISIFISTKKVIFVKITFF